MKPARLALVALVIATLGGAWCADARADKRTVCTVTVNSPDERELFRRSLPEDQYQFVELVERGRPDWLARACQQKVSCDMLIISGHFDGGTEFYSDRVDAREFLPIEELERVSCSDSCPGLFKDLKEVYLFGCNTLNPEISKSAANEIVRSQMAAGRSQAESEELARTLAERHNESSREQMRRIFPNVPVIYGFSALAPLGPTAAAMLTPYFQSAASVDVGSGRASADLLGRFSGTSMTTASGVAVSDSELAHRRDVCQFYDDRLSPSQKLDFVHEVLNRGMPEARMFFDRIEQFVASVDESAQATPTYASALNTLAADKAARERYLTFAHDAGEPPVRLRMIDVATKVGWLTPAEQRAEQMHVFDDILAKKTIGLNDVDLVCSMNADHGLDPVREGLGKAPAVVLDTGRAAVLACLGSRDAHARVLRGLIGGAPADIDVAEVYFRHRPITDVRELRAVALGIGRMRRSDAQVRALDTLARHNLSDGESLQTLAKLYPRAENASVQRAIAGNFIRADYTAIGKTDVLRVVRDYRLKSSSSDSLIDALIRRLQLP